MIFSQNLYTRGIGISIRKALRVDGDIMNNLRVNIALITGSWNVNTGELYAIVRAKDGIYALVNGKRCRVVPSGHVINLLLSLPFYPVDLRTYFDSVERNVTSFKNKYGIAELNRLGSMGFVSEYWGKSPGLWHTYHDFVTGWLCAVYFYKVMFRTYNVGLIYSIRRIGKILRQNPWWLSTSQAID